MVTENLNPQETLIRSAARRLTGYQRRLFIAEVTLALCEGNPRLSERRFGWGRDTAATGLQELQQGLRCLENFSARGKVRSEDKHPQLKSDIRAIVEPHTQADPELKTGRRYTNMTAAEVRTALIEQKGWNEQDLPRERTFRSILNRMNYRLKRLKKSKPLKKTAETEAIFENVKAVQAQVRDDPQTLEISIDTKAKVNLGEYSRGGKKPHGFDGRNTGGAGS